MEPNGTIKVTVESDRTPPELSITKPAVNQTVGPSVQIEGTAMDKGGMDRIEVLADGALLKTVPCMGEAGKQVPFSAAWDASRKRDGRYSIEVRAFDVAGKRSMELRVVTLDATAPAIKSADAAASHDSVKISWTTDEASDSQVAYGETYPPGTTSPLAASLVRSHAVTLAGLKPGRRYYYQARSRDKVGNLGTSGTLSFRTRKAVIFPDPDGKEPPGLVFKPPRVSWIKPADGSYVKRRVALEASAAPAGAARSPAEPGPEREPEVVYGDDDRQDLYEVKNKRVLRLAASTVALFPASSVSVDAWSGWATLKTVHYGRTNGLCTDERYYDQPGSVDRGGVRTGAQCSGSLVGPDMIMTAGHCVETQSECENTKFVFGFGLSSAGADPTKVPAADVYSCSKLLAQAWSAERGDWALVQLDRTVKGRSPLVVNPTSDPEKGEPLFVVGHPMGLPAKVAGGASVRDASPDKYFLANLDTYGGNSGSPVFHARTGLVVGILVGGEDDFESHGSCNRSKVCDDDACKGESVTKMSVVSPKIAGFAGEIRGVSFSVDGAGLGSEDAAAPYEAEWDASRAKEGEHVLTATARAASGLTASESVRVRVDKTAPSIEGLMAARVGERSAVIRWTTNEGADAKVEYGTTVSYGSSAGRDSREATHEILLDGLSPGTRYHFRAHSKDKAGNEAISGDGTFTTLEPPPPPGELRVEITAPADGAAVSGVVTVAAAAKGPSVAGVRFAVDGRDLGPEDTSVPYEAAWDASAAEPGAHTISATIRDSSGRTASDSISVRVPPRDVPDTNPPAAAIETPFDGQAVAGVVRIKARARDDTGISRAEAFVDGKRLGEGGRAPRIAEAPPAASGPGTVPAGVREAAIEFSWDSAKEQDGPHALLVKVYDPAGNEGRAAIGLRSDNTPPRIDNVAAGWSGPASAVVKWATGEPADAQVEYGPTPAYGRASPRRLSRDRSHEVALSGLAQDGETHFRVLSRDEAGNLSASADHVLRPQGPPEPPPPPPGRLEVEITKPGDGATVAGRVTVAAKLAGAGRGASVRFSADGHDLGEDAEPPYETVWDASSAEPGPHVLAASARDGAGRSATASIRVKVAPAGKPDTKPPVVSIKAPLSGQTVARTIQVVVRASDETGIARAQAFVDGEPLDPAGREPRIAEGGPGAGAAGAAGERAPLDGPPSTGAGAPLLEAAIEFTWDTRGHADGTRVLLVKAFDPAGNEGRASIEVRVDNAGSQGPDTTPPLLSFTAPSAAAVLSGMVRVSVKATDDTAVAGVSWLLDGEPFGSEDTLEPYDVDWDTRFVKDGPRRLTALARDAAGNKASAHLDVTISNAAPPPEPLAVALSSPPDGERVSGKVQLRAKAKPESRVAAVEFFVDGARLARDEKAPFAARWNTRESANGRHTLTAKAVDASGASTEASVTVEVRNEPRPPADVPEPLQAWVGRGEPAAIEDPATKARLDIPAGAVASTSAVMITVAPAPAQPSGRRSRTAAAGASPLSPAGLGVELGPEGLRFQKPVTLRLALSSCGAAQAAIYHWNPETEQWEKVPGSRVDPASCEAVADLEHFSVYAPFEQASPAARLPLGETYVYPNPARDGRNPVFHVETETGNGMEVKVFDVAGNLVHQARVDGPPKAVTRAGRAVKAYEHTWDVSNHGSGVYFYTIDVQGSSGGAQAPGKFVLIRR